MRTEDRDRLLIAIAKTQLRVAAVILQTGNSLGTPETEELKSVLAHIEKSANERQTKPE